MNALDLARSFATNIHGFIAISSLHNQLGIICLRKSGARLRLPLAMLSMVARSLESFDSGAEGAGG
jgi:hypothetical protein